ncbi:MAG: GNAT family N-acetyltransferase [Candidatus Buchananbacteria bacterium]
MIKFVKPTIKYQKTFLAGVKEIQKVDKELHMDLQLLDLVAVKKDFKSYLKKIREREKGINLPQGYISSSDYWLIVNNQFAGKAALRHKLTSDLKKSGGHIGYIIRPSFRKKGYGTKILQLALLKAKKLGLKKVLMTCDDTNTGSQKIIEKNGGVLENKIMVNNKLKRRYWISLE